MTSPHSPPSRATAREWIGLPVLALPSLLASMDLSILFVAVPSISADLAPTGTQQLWIMDIYGFVLAGLLITMGNIGDRIGRRKMLLIGTVAFGAASLVAAFSTSAEMLIAARVLLGVGAAGLAPSTLSLIRGMFLDESQRRTAVGVWTAAWAGGPAIGPIIGGFVLEYFEWGAVFLINVPVMLVLLIATPLILRESRDPDPGRFDLLSAALSLAAVLPIIYGLKKLVEDGVDGLAVGALSIGVVFAVLFVIRQLLASSPMLDVRLFTRPAFSASIGANGVMIFGVGGMGLVAVTFMQTVLGFGPLQAALWMLPTVLGSFIGVTVASVLARHVRPAFLLGAGMVVASAGFFLVATLDADAHIATLITGYAMLTLGMGVATTLANSLVLTTAPPQKAGAASAMVETSAEFGGALGIAALGSVSATLYRSQMQDRVPADVGEAGVRAAEDTVSGAVAVADEAPAEIAGPLLTDAFEAYTAGVNLAALCGGLLLLVVGVLAGIALRRVPRQLQDAGEADGDGPAGSSDGDSSAEDARLRSNA